MKGILISAVILASLSINTLFAQEVTITKGTETFNTGSQPANEIEYLMSKDGVHYFYLDAYYGSNKILKIDNNLNFVGEITLDDSAPKKEGKIATKAIGDKVFLFTHTETIDEGEATVKMYPINVDGSLGTPKNIWEVTFGSEKNNRGDFNLTVSDDKSKFALYAVDFHGASQKDVVPGELKVAVFNSEHKKLWESKTMLSSYFQIFAMYSGDRKGFKNFQKHLDNTGAFSVVLTNFWTEGEVPGNTFVSFNAKGDLIIQDEKSEAYTGDPSNIIISNFDWSVYHTDNKVLLCKKQSERVGKDVVMYYTYTFYDKATGKTIKKGHANLNEILLEQARQKMAAFWGPQIVVDGEKVYAIIEEYSGDTQWNTSTIHGDLIVMKHGEDGTLNNVMYVPKGQMSVGMGKDYYNGSFAAIAANNNLYMYYTQLDAVSTIKRNNDSVKNNKRGTVYQVKIGADDAIITTEYYDGWDAKDPMRPGTLVKIGENDYLVILENKGKAKLARLQVK